METLIKHFLIPLITAALLLYSEVQSSKRIKKDVHGKFFLKLSSIYKWLGFLCCFIASFITGPLIANFNEELFLLGPLTVLLFLGMGVGTLIWYYHYTLIFDQKRIVATNWKKQPSEIAWDAIENIKFNTLTSNLKIYSKQTIITIPQQTVGFIELLNLMEEKTKFSAKELKIRL